MNAIISDPLSIFKPCYDRTVVTGGGSGIGRSVALALARLGGTVYVMGRRLEKLKETVSMHGGQVGRIIPVTCDIRDATVVDAAFKEVEKEGPAQALVHAAAEVDRMLAEHITPQIFMETAVNQLCGTFHVVQRWATPLREGKKPGCAVTFSSALCGRETPSLAHSSATKAGVESLTRTLASEWARFNLRLNVIGPGLFSFEDAFHAKFYHSERGKRMLESIPLHRSGSTEEIVGPTLFLLSHAGAYTTGEVVIVDGGLKLKQFFAARPEDYESAS